MTWRPISLISSNTDFPILKKSPLIFNYWLAIKNDIIIKSYQFITLHLLDYKNNLSELKTIFT